MLHCGTQLDDLDSAAGAARPKEATPQTTSAVSASCCGALLLSAWPAWRNRGWYDDLGWTHIFVRVLPLGHGDGGVDQTLQADVLDLGSALVRPVLTIRHVDGGVNPLLRTDALGLDGGLGSWSSFKQQLLYKIYSATL